MTYPLPSIHALMFLGGIGGMSFLVCNNVSLRGFCLLFVLVPVFSSDFRASARADILTFLAFSVVCRLLLAKKKTRVRGSAMLPDSHRHLH